MKTVKQIATEANGNLDATHDDMMLYYSDSFKEDGSLDISTWGLTQEEIQDATFDNGFSFEELIFNLNESSKPCKCNGEHKNMICLDCGC